MNIPIERLEIAAKSLEDMPFVKQNWDKLQEAVNEDRFFEDKDPHAFIRYMDRIRFDSDELHGAGSSQILFPYMKWIFMLYIKQLILVEDVRTIRNLLLKYDKLKRTGRLPNEYKNIYDIRTPQELHRIVEKIERNASLILNSEIYHWEEKGEIEIHDEFPKFKVIIPLTLKGATAMSKGTNWCTAQSDNQWAKYNNGTLYILIINQRAMYQFYSEYDVPYFTEVKDHKDHTLRKKDIEKLRDKYTMILRNAFPDKIEFGNLSPKEKFDIVSTLSRVGHRPYVHHWITREDVKKWSRKKLKELLFGPYSYGHPEYFRAYMK